MKHRRGQENMMPSTMYMDNFMVIGKLLNSTLDKPTNFSTNYCGYSKFSCDVMVSWVH